MVAVLSSGFLAWTAFEYWRLHRRSRGLRHRAQAATRDLEDLISLLYALAPEHLGGCLTNATIRAVERSGPAHDVVTIFASGGWRFQPHSLTGLPMRCEYPTAPTEDSADQRLRYWIASTLGKGTTLNGSLGFLLAMLALEAEKSGGEGAPLGISFRGRRITQVGMCSGTLYTSVASLQRSAAEARARSPASASAAASAALPNCVACASVNRIEVVCELGTVSPPLLRAFQRRHWGYTPDPRSEQLGEVCEFGTQAVLDHWRSSGCLPVQGTEQFENVFWERRDVSVQTMQGKDHWVWIEVESEESAAAALKAGAAAAARCKGRAAQDAAAAAASAASPILATSRLHIDTSIFFARGLSAGFRDDDAAAAAAAQAAAASGGRGVWESVCAGWKLVSRKLAALSPFSSSDSASSAAATVPAPLLPLSSLPRAMLLPDSLVLDSRGLGSRINVSASGARAVIAHIQSAVLINSEGANPTHTQMRSVLLEALALCGLKNRLLTHKISMQPTINKRKTKHRAAATQQQHQQRSEHSAASSYASESSATSSGCTSATPESHQSDDETDAAEDDDDGAIAVDTDAHRHNVEQLD